MGMSQDKGTTGGIGDCDILCVFSALVGLSASSGRFNDYQWRIRSQGGASAFVAHGLRFSISGRPTAFLMPLQNGISWDASAGHTPRLNVFLTSSRPPSSVLNQF